MCCSCVSPYSRNRALGSVVSDQVVVADVLVRAGCRGRAACAIADRMRRAVCRGASVFFTGSVDMELVNRWKCVVYHFVTVGCGFVRGGSGAPILQRIPRRTRAWSDMGICMVS